MTLSKTSDPTSPAPQGGPPVVIPAWHSRLVQRARTPQALSALVVVALAFLPVLVSSSYVLSLMVSIGIFSILALGLVLLLGYCGQLSIGHAAFFGLGAYVSGYLSKNLAWPSILSMLAAVVVALVVALVVGAPALRLKRFYFAVATMAFGIVMTSLFEGLSVLTGGPSGLTGIPRFSLGPLLLKTDLHYYFLVWPIVFVCLWLVYNISRSRVGRALQAIRTDDMAAATNGIDVAHYKIQVFLVSVALAALAGSIYAQYLRLALPESFGLTTAVDMLVMVLLGGTRSVWGALLGAGLIKFLPDTIQVFRDYQLLIKGFILLLVMIYLPSGLAGFVAGAWQGLMAKTKHSTAGKAQWSDGDVDLLDEEQTSPKFNQSAKAGEVGDVILKVVGVTKSFGGVMAVSRVSFDVRAGQIKSLVGPNGAGKTTLFNLLTGVTPADAGQVYFLDQEITRSRPHVIARAGVTRTFQNVRLFEGLSVGDNVLVGGHRTMRIGLLDAALRTARARREEMRARRQAYAWLKFVGLQERVGDSAVDLPLGQQRLLEIARALAGEPRLVLLDEPAAGLNESEKERLGALLVQIRRAGITVLLVEHNMDLVMGISDEIVVLDHGEKIAEGSPSEVQRDQRVIVAYLGEDEL